MDGEAREALRILNEDLDAVDARAGRAFVHEGDEALDRRGLAFEDRFHGAVAVVPDPARDAPRLGAAADGVAEEHAVYEAVRDRPFSRDGVRHRLLLGESARSS